MANQISNSFERGFLGRPLAVQIFNCEQNELAALFLEIFREKQPVLEAGCGSGKWCGWLAKHGIRAAGLDWSGELISRAQKEMPHCHFEQGDLRALPYPHQSFGGIISLGSIEHTIEGPEKIISEFYRVLIPGGKLIVTFPQGNFLRKMLLFIRHIFILLLSLKGLRELFGKFSWRGTRFSEIYKKAERKWNPLISFGPEGFFFYEYRFFPKHILKMMVKQGFRVLKGFPCFYLDGIFHNLGNFFCRYDSQTEQFKLTSIGHVLRNFLFSRWDMGHMFCFVLEKEE